MKPALSRFLCAPLLAFLLVSCEPSRNARNIVRNDLFSISYGLSENQIDISSGGESGIDLTMREGIFHLLDGTGGKVLKLSSYGDLLALLYDPSRSPEPRIVKPIELLENEAQNNVIDAPGRYAAPIKFEAPGKIAVDADQTIYIADRVANSSDRIFDTQIDSYCDRIVRRFGAQGTELPYIGQEGPGGSPFPHIMRVDVLGNGTVAVVSASETFVLVHHFAKAGKLLSSLRLSRSSLPVPDSLAESGGENEGVRIHANLDGILEVANGESFEITLKIDYYREYFDPDSLVISSNEFAGSWIFVLNGSTGKAMNSLAIVPGNPDTAIPELIGEGSGLFYLLSDSASSENELARQSGTGAGGKGSGAARMLQLVDMQGKVQQRYRLDLPSDAAEIMVLKVSDSGQVYALLKSDKAVRVAWWEYR